MVKPFERIKVIVIKCSTGYTWYSDGQNVAIFILGRLGVLANKGLPNLQDLRILFVVYNCFYLKLHRTNYR